MVRTVENQAKRGLRRLNAAMLLAFVAILALTAAVWFVSAVSVSNRRDLMSNMDKSETSAHQINFTLSGGNTFAAGEVIAVDFPATFVPGGVWAAADFAFTDGTVRTVASVNAGAGANTVVCADGANNIGVAVDTAAVIFRVIPCGASFAPTAVPGSAVTFTINGEAPDGTLTNPAAAGSYVINILDAAGDCTVIGDMCAVAAAIADSSRITITASVVSGCGNGIIEWGETCDDGNTNSGDGCSATCQTEGGGGPPPDITPPTITNVQAIGVTNNAATITWTTNEAANSTVRYGLTIAYGGLAFDPNYLLSHSVPLSSLNEGATYHYQVCSSDGAANQFCSADYTFNTVDLTPPAISNVQVSGVTLNQATLTWSTDENATSFVDYATAAGPPYANTSGAAAPLLANHSVTLSGLNPGTTYHYRVRSGDGSGNESFTADATFVTLGPPDITPPVITGVQATNITETGAIIIWTTNENADSKVDYGLTAAYGTTVTDANQVTSHSVPVAGLVPGTTYHFRVRSADGAANEAASGDFTFATATPPDVTPPVISNVQATDIAFNAARIIWTTDEAANSTVEYGLTVAYGSTASDPAMATSHSVQLSSLTAQTIYHYRVKSADASGNLATSGDLTFVTPIPPPPVISNIRVQNITESTASVLWDTVGSSSDSRVDYGLTAAYGSTVTSAIRVTDHLLNLMNLAQGTTYNYKITSVDQYGQSVSSANRTFATVADTAAPGNVTGLTVTPGDKRNDLAWTNPADADFAGVKILRKTTGFPTGPADGTAVYTGGGTSHADINLTNGVTYYYAVFAFDEVPNHASGAVGTGTPVGPPDVTPPGDVSNFTATPGDARIDLAWTNPADADLAGVLVVRKEGSCPTSRNDGTTVYSGLNTSLIDAGRTNGTLYCYRAFAYDAVPNYSAGVDAQATPVAPPDVTPPGPVTNFQAAPGDAIVQLTWINPGDADWAATRILRKTTGFPTGPADGTVVFDGRGDNRLDGGLTNGTTYYYAAYAYDNRNNFAAPATAQASPQAGVVPPPAPSCTDSDGGKQYDIFGTATDNAGAHDDVCAGGTAVTEYFCDGTGSAASEIHVCGGGFKCTGGRCVPETFQPGVAICGNGLCEENENSLNCPTDCPLIQEQKPAEPQGAVERQLTPRDLIFLATAGNLELKLGSAGDLTTYAAMAVEVILPDESIIKPINSAYINLAGGTYIMTPRASMVAKIITPAGLGVHPAQVVVNYADGTSDTVTVNLRIVARISIVESVGGAETALGGARVTLWRDSGGGVFNIWNGSPYGESNPAVTDGNGLAGFIVPPGSYKVAVDMDGYYRRETMAFPIATENVITQKISLVKTPPPLELTVESITDNAVAVTAVAADVIGEAMQNEYVEQAATDIAAPAATAVAAANVVAIGVTSASGIPYLMYLFSLLAHPVLLFARRKRKEWGIVYDALTKRPVDLVIVRLVDARTQRVLRSAVTDKDGRYFFIVQTGEYKLTASKAGFAFPTAFLKDSKEDGIFLDLYHGENIVFKEPGTIAVNIPLDATVAEKTNWQIKVAGFGRKIQRSLGIVSILAMAVATAIKPTKFMVALTAVNVIIYLILRRLSVSKRPKNWGVVFDDATGKPVRNALARIFESRFNKLLETQVTDSRGRYSFLVGKNVYYVTFEKPGYQKEQKGPIDLLAVKTGKQHEGLVSLDIKMKPLGREAAGKGGPEPAQKPLAVSFTPSAPSVSPPSAPPVSPPPAPPVSPPPAPKPVSWEIQLAQRLAQKPPAPLPPIPPVSPPPFPPVSPSPGPSPKPSPPALPESPPVKSSTPSASSPPPSTPSTGLSVPRTPLIQDAEHAHPGEFKGIEGPDEGKKDLPTSSN